MGECRGGGDCLIKLFGKTIPVQEAGGDVKDLQKGGSNTAESEVEENTHQDSPDPPPQPKVVDAEDSEAIKNSSPMDDASNLKEKLKKPDKILPCPRCNSMDTKFCYFNNYNVNQPRHFCKNCQRYWTAGGAMRNVPVGAGRRKNKNAAAACHFLQRVRAVLPGDPLCQPIKTNGTVLSFSRDTSTLDLTEQITHLKDKLTPVRQTGKKDILPIGSCSEGSSNSDDKHQTNIKEKVTAEKSANAVQHPCMNGGTMWPYSCAPSPAAYYTSGIAVPLYPGTTYWGCMVPGAWSLPWLAQTQPQAVSSPNAVSSVSSGCNSLTLGKHPREGDEERGDGNGKVWVPKTVRIDDADEVARSSIRSLIGIKGNTVRVDASRHKLGRVFEPKGEVKTAKHTMITSLPLLHTNPVALSRSVIFQERS